MAYDPELLETMRTAMQGRKGISEKKMFGGFMWMLNGNMLCGVEVGRFMFRVGKEREKEALSRPGASPMDINGRPMGGLVWVNAEDALRDGLDDWIALASRFVRTLPAKYSHSKPDLNIAPVSRSQRQQHSLVALRATLVTAPSRVQKAGSVPALNQ